MKSLRRIAAIARKELRQLRRDRLTFGMIVGVPMIQLTLFGYAINQDVRHLRAGVADLAGTSLSRALVADTQASQVLDVVASADGPGQLQDLIRQGSVDVGLVIPPDFERRVAARDGRTPAQLLVDASDPIVLASARSLARIPLARRAPLQAATPDTFEVRAFYNPERRSPVQIVPGLIGVILTMTMVLFTGIAIVRERERGNLEMLITTPVRTTELMLGKILPYIFIGLVQVSLILALGVALFAVPVRGDLFDLYVGSLAFIASTLTMGLLVSTVAQTQFQAMQLTFFFFLPSILLSGFMFPFDGMPPAAQALGEVLPLTHYVRIARGIVLRGASLTDIQRELWPLAGFFLVTMALSIARFRKRLD